MLDNPLVIWLFLAFVVERLVEGVKVIFPAVKRLQKSYENEVAVPLLIALVFSGVIIYGTDLDFFRMFNLDFKIPYAGIVVTAFFTALGTPVVHDVISWVENKKNSEKQKVA